MMPGMCSVKLKYNAARAFDLIRSFDASNLRDDFNCIGIAADEVTRIVDTIKRILRFQTNSHLIVWVV